MKKVIVITGASDGLGKELAKDLVKDNIVIGLSPNKNKIEEVAKELNCDYRVCDVSKYQQVEQTIKDIVSKYNRIDILINNAGLWIQDELEYNENSRIEDVIGTNLIGVINMSKYVITPMKNQKDGIIININSQAGINYKAERVVYNASKWGVTGFTKSLQAEVAKYGIRVTDVYPGMMKTNMFNKMGISKNMNNGLSLKEMVRVINFIIDTPSDVMIPEIGIKNINN